MATRTATLRAKREKKPRPVWVKRLKQAFALLFILGLIATCYIGFRFMGVYKRAEELVRTIDEKMSVVQVLPSKIVSADGVVLYQVSDVYRKPLGDFSKIPPHMRDAIIAAEDKRFWQHGGVDFWGLARALGGIARDHRVSQGGGSTITMQLAKRLFSGGEQTFDRKLQDIAVAMEIEKHYSKQQILTMYLDQVYFGSGAYGVQAASEIYFGKTVDELSLGECAMLARCVQRPSDVNPYKNLQRSVENRDLVLGTMLEMKTISQREYDKAIAEKPKLRQKTAPQLTVDLRNAPYFVQHVLEDLKDQNIDMDTLKLGGYTIHTTLDYKTQKIAEEQVRKIVRDYRGEHVTTAAFVLMDKEGQIKAEVGGVSYKRSNFNIVTHGMRQAGSSFKPFVYSAAFQEGKLGIYDDLPDLRRKFHPGMSDEWTPRNSNAKYYPSVPVRSAFMYSMNVPAAEVMERVGPDKAVEYANGAFGFTSPFKPYMSLVLGAQDVRPIEMAQAYSVFMLRGNRATPYTITKIEQPDGEPISFEPKIVPNVLSPEVADDTDALMRAVATGGTGKEAKDVPNARGKTGTTSDNKDAWFCGYSDGLIGIGWVGNETIRKNGSAVYGQMGRAVFGGTVTVQFWRAIMLSAHDRLSSPMPERPLAFTFGERGGGGSGHTANPDGDPGAIPDDVPVPDGNPDAYPTSIPDYTPAPANGGNGGNGDPPGTDPVPPPTTTGGGTGNGNGGAPPPRVLVKRGG